MISWTIITRGLKTKLVKYHFLEWFFSFKKKLLIHFLCLLFLELKRAFQAYVIKDHDEDDDVILSKDLGNVLRSLGQNLSNMEIMDMINELGDEGKAL